MMKVRYWWEKFPTAEETIRKYGKGNRKQEITLFGLLVLTITLLLIVPPFIIRLFDGSYISLLLAKLVHIFVITAFLAWLSKGQKIMWLVGAQLLVSLAVLLPCNVNTSNDTSLEPGVVYIMQDDDCKYCEAANTSLRLAVNLYNITHSPNIQVIDRDDTSKIAQELTNTEIVNGTIYKQTENGIVTTNYVMMEKDNNPVSPSVSYVYDKLITVVKGK